MLGVVKVGGGGVLRNAPIGVMDSGIGGLTVVKEIWRQLPRESIVFYGDSQRCPYGDRTPDDIRMLSFQILDFLVAQGVKMLVIACNTATAIILDEARRRYDVPVLGVIAPGARAAIAATSNQKIGIIGTQATINSKSYSKTLRQTHHGMEIVSQACPKFVDLVERGVLDEVEALPIVSDSLEAFRGTDIDTMVLGCTHYPLLTPLIAKVLGPDVRLISSAEETARDISHWLTEEHLNRLELDDPKHVFYTSGDVNRFAQIGEAWLQQPIQVIYHDVWEKESEVRILGDRS